MKNATPLLFLIVLFAAAGWYFFVQQPEPAHELLPPEIAPPVISDVQQPAAEPDGAQEEQAPVADPEPLPPLAESDPAIKQALLDIVGNDAVQTYLVKTEAISRFVAAVDSLTSRQVPAAVNPIKPVDGKFQVQSVDDRVVLSGDNFARYDDYVALLDEMSTGELLAIFHRYSPLFQQAWEENGRNGTFNDRLLAVIDELLATPDPEGLVYLSKPEAVYVFEDPELEKLSAGQKILIRMGGANASLVKTKLIELKSGLIPQSDPVSRHPRN